MDRQETHRWKNRPEHIRPRELGREPTALRFHDQRAGLSSNIVGKLNPGRKSIDIYIEAEGRSRQLLVVLQGLGEENPGGGIGFDRLYQPD